MNQAILRGMALIALAAALETAAGISPGSPFPPCLAGEPPPTQALDPTGARVMQQMASTLEQYYYLPSELKLARLNDTCLGCAEGARLSEEEKTSCSGFYGRFANTHTLRIQVSFGYTDFSEGTPYFYNGQSLGKSAAVDVAYAEAFRRSLRRPCAGALQACGFILDEVGHYIKTVTPPGPGALPVTVDVTVNDASLTPSHQINTRDRRAEQNTRSFEARAAWLDAIQNADVSLYVGHSRNGGGPDFFPPRLMANGRPDYRGYYMPRKPGLKDLLGAIRSRGEPPPLLGFFSCFSEYQFGKVLQSATPGSGFIFTATDQALDMDDNANGAFATIDSLLRFQCAPGFQNELSVSAKDGPRVFLRNFLSRSQPVQTLLPAPPPGD